MTGVAKPYKHAAVLQLTRVPLVSDKVCMIELTRLNGHAIAVNCDLIRYAEAAPDTVLTLVTGEKLLVRETVADVMKLTFGYRASVLRSAWPDAMSLASTVVAAKAQSLTPTPA